MKYANVMVLSLAVVLVVYSLSVTYGAMTGATAQPIEITKLSPSEVELPSLQPAAEVERTPPLRRSGSSRDLFRSRTPTRQPADPGRQLQERSDEQPANETESAAQESPQVPVQRPQTNVISVGRSAGSPAAATQTRGAQTPVVRGSSQQPNQSGGFAPAPPPFRGAQSDKRTSGESGTASGRPSPPPVRGSITRR